MHSGNRFVPARKAAEAILARAQTCLSRGDFAQAETLAQQALNDWRAAAAPREEEGDLVMILGKSLLAQHKYPQAYDLYMQALNYLTGPSYDEVYASFLYLNERMGTFKEPDKNAGSPSPENEKQAPTIPAEIPSGYYDDFEKK